MSARTRLIVATTLAAGLVAGAAAFSARTHAVAPGEDVAAVIARARSGDTVLLQRGVHDGFTLDRRVTVRGEPGAVVEGGILVAADGARIADLFLRGGETGIEVRDVDRVVIEGVAIRGVELHGVDVVDSSAVIRGCSIAGMRSPYAQGIEVRNAFGRAPVVVEGCVVDGGQEGIVSHVSEVAVRDNTLTGTTLRAIAVTEMSGGVVEGNLVAGVTGVGLYCGDMSHCDFRDNVVRGVAADLATSKTQGGYGAVAWYHSIMRESGNLYAVDAADPVLVTLGSHLSAASPVEEPRPAPHPGPAIAVILAAAALLLARVRPPRAVARRVAQPA